MACSAYNPFCEIFMVFYTAINPIVLIEFIDIRNISKPGARPGLDQCFDMYCCFNHLREDESSRQPGDVQPFSTRLNCFGSLDNPEELNCNVIGSAPLLCQCDQILACLFRLTCDRTSYFTLAYHAP